MPSTYSTSLKLQLIGTGEQAGVWGTTTNYNLGTLLEQAITGVITIPMGDATYTLTNYNGLSDEARNAVLVLQGPITAPQELIAPAGQQKVYVIRNFTGNTVTIKTTAGNGVALTNAASAVVFTDGTNFFSATTLNYIDGNLTVTGSVSVGTNLTVGANATVTGRLAVTGASTVGGTQTVTGALIANSTLTVAGTANMASTTILTGQTLPYNDIIAQSSGQWWLPRGTNAQRTGAPVIGIIRYNTEQGFYEGYSAGLWVRFLTVNQGAYTARLLVISGGAGGGGGGGFYSAGGGGAGGVISTSFGTNPGATYTFVVGAGGAFNNNGSGSSANGTGISAAPIGGGTGGEAFVGAGVSGGSGGGAGQRVTTPGFGTAGQGNNGGIGNFDGSGGGGGWGGVGGNATGEGGGNRRAGNGGIGAISDITGTAVYYAGGGGGASQDFQGTGGTGGGGNAIGGAGVANTGGGGGAGGFSTVGGSGGSGVVILSVPSIYYSGVYSGTPVITSTGGNTILKYNSSGTYTA